LNRTKLVEKVQKSVTTPAQDLDENINYLRKFGASLDTNTAPQAIDLLTYEL
jgi:hypothetical protein